MRHPMLPSSTPAGFIFAILIALLSSRLPTSASAATIYVNAAAAPGGNGTSWGAAYSDLRAALIASVTGDQVWIARGTYRPTASLDRALRFDVPSGVQVFGGFAGYESSTNERPADPDPGSADPADDTILSGEIGAPGSADNSLTVMDLSFSNINTRLDRLVITGGSNDGGRGGGMRIGYGSPTITRCLFINNNASEGGALWIVNASGAVIEDCVFRDNTAYSAGAVAVQSAHPTFRRTRFQSNTCTSGGGAVMNTFGSGGTYEDCDFLDCAAGGVGGGAIYTVWQPTAGTLTITNSTFTNCRAAEAPVAGAGGALYTNGPGTLTVSSCEFEGCRADQGGALNNQGGHAATYSDCTFTNCVGGPGGAALFWNAVSFVDCRFENNSGGSGGACHASGAGTFERCTFKSNSTRAPVNSGGAVYLTSASAFTDCHFEMNSAAVGGAIYATAGPQTLDRCRFTLNSASGSGGCFFGQFSGSAIITNSLFIGNQSGFYGSVATVSATTGAPTSFINCTMTGNTAPQSVVRAFTPINLSNCILRNPGSELAGSTDVTYSNVEGGAAGAGNIDADPLFVDASSGDLRLSPSSPCIDAGRNDRVPAAIQADMAILPRYVDDPSTPDTGVGPAPIVDMGAFEMQAAPPAHCPGDADGSGQVNFADITSVLTNFGGASAPGAPGDADASGMVDFGDITSVLTNWGADCTS
ncbi:MAG: hypothetical protein JNK58_09195 [Phycisphaerae bacterium]|nr:hypothetical protein [Phycisphaerae bacterium]